MHYGPKTVTKFSCLDISDRPSCCYVNKLVRSLPDLTCFTAPSIVISYIICSSLFLFLQLAQYNYDNEWSPQSSPWTRVCLLRVRPCLGTLRSTRRCRALCRSWPRWKRSWTVYTWSRPTAISSSSQNSSRTMWHW